MTLKIQILLAGIKVKLNRGEHLEEILQRYTKLSDSEKMELTEYFSKQEE